MTPEWSKNTIHNSSLLSIEERFNTIYQALKAILAGHQSQPRLLFKTKDIWAMDYMVIQIGIDEFLEYRSIQPIPRQIP